MTWSNLSSFATGSSLWAESALSVVAFCLFSVWAVFVRLSLVLFLFWSFLLLFLLLLVVWGCPLQRLSPLGSSPSLSLFLGGVCLPVRWGLSFLCSLISGFFWVSLYSWGFCCVFLCWCGCCCLIRFFSFIILSFYFSWRRASGKFPSPPVLLQLQFFGPHSAVAPGLFTSALWSTVSMAVAPFLHSHSGHCAWLIHLSPLVRCVHGIASLARSHIDCCDRTCGDGSWSFLLPYRLLR